MRAHSSKKGATGRNKPPSRNCMVAGSDGCTDPSASTFRETAGAITVRPAPCKLGSSSQLKLTSGVSLEPKRATAIGGRKKISSIFAILAPGADLEKTGQGLRKTCRV